jgi:hypothetical protein
MFYVLLGPVRLEFVQYLAIYTIGSGINGSFACNECNIVNPMYIQ